MTGTLSSTNNSCQKRIILYETNSIFLVGPHGKGLEKMSFSPMMQKGSFALVRPDHHGKIKKETVSLEGVSVTRVTFGVGAKWSQDLKEYAGTESCQLPHVALVLSGTLHVVMDDGSAENFSENEVMLLPPGHDAWTVGADPCVFVEFSRGNDYYGSHGAH